jgi:predicted HicB family RNase H-like nuclease
VQKLSEKAKENKIKYTNNWKRQNVKRIGLEVSPAKYEEIKQAADSSGESVNGYIKKAIDDRLYKDK